MARMAVKLVVVMRTDLDMGRGKIAAQAAHAAVTAVLDNRGNPDLLTWFEEGQPKVVLKTSGEETLSRVCAAATEAGLPVTVIRDAGRTQVESGTTTCCAIGPAASERIDRVTGSLSLL